MSVQIQLRRGTAAQWTSADPTLAQGEVGIETDTGKIKFGDGTTAWNSLAYFAGEPALVDDSVTNAKLANMAQSTIKGRAAGAGAGDPTDLTVAQAVAILQAIIANPAASQTIESQGAAVVPLILKGHASQSGDLVDIVNSAGTVLARVDASGLLSVDGAGAVGLIQARAFSADTSGAHLRLTKSRNATRGSHTIVQNGDIIGEVQFLASDGSVFRTAADIVAFVDGTPGASDMPGRLGFYTTPDGSAGIVERVRIRSDGHVGIGASGDPSVLLQAITAESAVTIMNQFAQQYASFAGAMLDLNYNRAATSGAQFIRAFSGGYGDQEFLVRGDGAVFSDIAASTPADYAEYFESASGQAIAPGISVVLDNGKVRPAKANDPASAIIGVVRPRGTSSLVGNSAWARWTDKYLKDDFGAYVMEDYEAWEWEEEITEEVPTTDPPIKGMAEKRTRKELRSMAADGPLPEGVKKKPARKDVKVTIQHRRKLNPAYDPSMEYVPREDRPEWVIVGLLGQVPVRKGQPVGDRWIKMRAVSPTVDMYLIR